MNSFDNTFGTVPLRYDTIRTKNLSISPVIEAKLLKHPRAILWCNDGLFGVISMERVKNAVILRNEKRGAGVVPTPLVFSWNEVHILTPDGKSLTSSEKRMLGPSTNTTQTP